MTVAKFAAMENSLGVKMPPPAFGFKVLHPGADRKVKLWRTAAALIAATGEDAVEIAAMIAEPPN